jgi:hypothetical protein
MAAASENTLTLTVKLMNGEYILADIPRDSKWPSHDLARALERMIGIPYYYQKFIHIDPATNEPYTTPHSFTEKSILLLLVQSADVYIKKQEIYIQKITDGTITHTMESTRYSIHVYHEKVQRAFYSFLVDINGYHFFNTAATKSIGSWGDRIFRKKLSYAPCLEEALSPLPTMIRDEVLRKWGEQEIIPTAERMPYSRARQPDDTEEDDD